MILVDTSVWIRFLANRQPYAADLDRLLDSREVVGHDLIAGELIIGDSGGRRDLLSGYALIERLPTVVHDEVLAFVRTRGLHGQGIGWIDAHLLASALLGDANLWTADRALARLAGELGVGYRPNVH